MAMITFNKMNRMKWNLQFLFIFLQFSAIAFCYPIGNMNQNSQAPIKSERRFPNGTIIGKYTYNDKDGTPIEIKYYADSSSYGVELNSVKIVNPDSSPTTSLTGSNESPADEELPKDFNSQLKPGQKLAKPMNSKVPIDEIEVLYPIVSNKYKPLVSYDYLNKENKENKHKKIEKPRPDYNIYFQNELKGDDNCRNEQVKLYLNEPSREIRSAVDFDAVKYCEHFLTQK